LSEQITARLEAAGRTTAPGTFDVAIGNPPYYADFRIAALFIRAAAAALRPGGRLAFAVWASGDSNPWVTIAGRILVARGHIPRSVPGEPGMFVLGDEQALRALVDGAGFASVQVEMVSVANNYRDVDDYVDRSSRRGGMFARAWAGASRDEREAMAAELRQAFEPFAVDRGYELPGLAICVLAS
jgi:hypothetical protein